MVSPWYIQHYVIYCPHELDNLHDHDTCLATNLTSSMNWLCLAAGEHSLVGPVRWHIPGHVEEEGHDVVLTAPVNLPQTGPQGELFTVVLGNTLTHTPHGRDLFKTYQETFLRLHTLLLRSKHTLFLDQFTTHTQHINSLYLLRSTHSPNINKTLS